MSEAIIIDGRKAAEDIKNEVRVDVKDWMKTTGKRAPHLTMILLNKDFAYYAGLYEKAADFVGIKHVSLLLPSTTTEEELISKIEELNKDDAVDGILVILPFPEGINKKNIFNSIHIDKDVDGFNERNIGRFCFDMNTSIPRTALSAFELLKRNNIETCKKNVVVIGRVKTLGVPMTLLLRVPRKNRTNNDVAENMDATVITCNQFTPREELKKFCLSADVIISAVYRANFVTADMVKPGATVIDAGLSNVVDKVTGKQKTVGDVDFEEVKKIAGRITPVPGGMGPMIVATLMRNTLVACKQLEDNRQNAAH